MKTRMIAHGVPQSDYFAILQIPDFSSGLDCSCIAEGVGLPYTLVNPHTSQQDTATLVMRRTVYIESDLFDALSMLVYGVSKHDVMAQLDARNPGGKSEVVELWVFKK